MLYVKLYYTVYIIWQIYVWLVFVLYLAAQQSRLTLTACNCREFYIFEIHVAVLTSEKEKMQVGITILFTHFDWFFLLIKWWTNVHILVCFFVKYMENKNNRFQVTMYLFNNFSQKTPKFSENICEKTTGSPSSLVTVNMTLRNGVIKRVCMGNTSILWNSSK